MAGQSSTPDHRNARPARKTPAERAAEHHDHQRQLKQEAAERRAAAAAGRAAENKPGSAT